MLSRHFSEGLSCHRRKALALLTRKIRSFVALLPSVELRNPQFGILPPKVVPVARTKKIMPRKEWKELQKQQAGGKGFHTSAAASSAAALQPSCYTAASGGALADALSPAVWGTGVDDVAVAAAAADGQIPDAVVRFESQLSIGWAPGEETASIGGRSDGNSSSSASTSGSLAAGCDSDNVIVDSGGGSGIADSLSQLSLCGCGKGEQQVRPMGAPDAPPLSAFSPLNAVLASHLALLGPAACAVIGVRAVGAEGGRGAR